MRRSLQKSASVYSCYAAMENWLIGHVLGISRREKQTTPETPLAKLGETAKFSKNRRNPIRIWRPDNSARANNVSPNGNTRKIVYFPATETYETNSNSPKINHPKINLLRPVFKESSFYLNPLDDPTEDIHFQKMDKLERYKVGRKRGSDRYKDERRKKHPNVRRLSLVMAAQLNNSFSLYRPFIERAG